MNQILTAHPFDDVLIESSLPFYDHKVVIYRTPSRSVFLIIRDGVVVETNSSYYLGMTETKARLGLSSVLRYWNPEAQDNEYPSVVEL